MFSMSCNSTIFPMNCDIYYPTESQDEYGAINRKWDYDYSAQCSFSNILEKSLTDNFQFDEDDETFLKLESYLYGRMIIDPRKSSSGLYYPLTNILVTNLRGGNCASDPFFIEADGDYVGEPTTFEIKTCQPYIGPFGKIEYYKVMLGRSDIQGLNNRVPC